MADLDFEHLLLKEYAFWKVYLHSEQYPYVGRCYAAATRADAHEYLDLTREEHEEFSMIIVPSWLFAVKSLFPVHKPNICFLGNTWNHAHGHLIPRYARQFMYEGIEFIDPNPKGNYAPYMKRDMGIIFLQQVKTELTHILSTF